MLTILERFKEPSSYAGLAALLTGLGVNFDPSWVQVAIYGLSALAGVASILLKEKPKA